MNQSVTGKSSSLTSSAKSKIVAAVSQQPGRLGREIATTLGLEKSAVNSFLYGEGKRLHGLVESKYRWYPKSMVQVKKPAPVVPAPPATPEPPVNSICGMLAQMNQTHAVLKIRQMPLNLVELAFGEDDYPLLDDRLKIELVMRKNDLESRPVETTVITKSNVNPWPWIMLALMGGFMLIQHLARHNAEPLVPQPKQVESIFKSSRSN